VGIIEIILIAVALSTDAFAISVSIGLTMQKFLLRNAIIVGLYFGISQALMPLLGYLVGGRFYERVAIYEHWIIFAIFLFLGIKMIIGSFKKDEKQKKEVSLSFSVMIPMAVATSIDALAAGVSFAFANVNVILAVILIGVITFTLSGLGVKIGGIVGIKFKSKAELFGGIILVALAIRALFEGL
jgi:putative Mn2+ efflux pump MntP